MIKGDFVKIIYEDQSKHKIIKGKLIDIDEYSITVEASYTGDIIMLGKRALIKISLLNKNDD
jgi:hypothetical protein